MKRAAIVVLASLALTGCDLERINTTPRDYEVAKVDCATHGGLVSVNTMLVILRDSRVDAKCVDGATVSRGVKR